MAEFRRRLSEELIQTLKEDPLFREKLLPDIRKEKPGVFPAIRDMSLSFYYKGGSLFQYDGQFKTNLKYGAIPIGPAAKSSISQGDLAKFTVAPTFQEVYDQIKERCALYSGPESKDVSCLYANSAAIAPQTPSVVLLDIEIAMYVDKNKNKDKDPDDIQQNGTNDRIDILLYDTETKSLCFCEAKHFSNGELWAVEGSKPKVCKQLRRYDEKILENRAQILQQYQNYVDWFNALFGTNLPAPEFLFPRVGLLIFGYDGNQENKIDQLLKEDGSLEGIPYYTTGSMNSPKLGTSKIQTLYKTITNPKLQGQEP